VVWDNVSAAARWRTKFSKMRDQGYIKAQWRPEIFNDSREATLHRSRECVQITTVSSRAMIRKRMEQ